MRKKIPICFQININNLMHEIEKNDLITDSEEITTDEDIQKVSNGISIIEQVDLNLKKFIQQLKNNEKLDNIIDLAIITYNNECYYHLPFTPLEDITYQPITCGLLNNDDENYSKACKLSLQKIDDQLQNYKDNNIKCTKPFFITISNNSLFKDEVAINEISTLIDTMRLEDHLNFLSLIIKIHNNTNTINDYSNAIAESPIHPQRELTINDIKTTFNWLQYELVNIVNSYLFSENLSNQNQLTIENCLE